MTHRQTRRPGLWALLLNFEHCRPDCYDDCCLKENTTLFIGKLICRCLWGCIRIQCPNYLNFWVIKVHINQKRDCLRSIVIAVGHLPSETMWNGSLTEQLIFQWKTLYFTLFAWRVLVGLLTHYSSMYMLKKKYILNHLQIMYLKKILKVKDHESNRFMYGYYLLLYVANTNAFSVTMTRKIIVR